MSIKYSTCTLFILIIATSTTAAEFKRQCSDIYNCVQCLRNPKCGWCSHVKGSKDGVPDTKCDETEKIADICEDGFVEILQTKYEIITNLQIKESREGKSIQMQPQKVSLKIRPGTNHTIDIKFRKASDSPIDMYYLLDFSFSMLKYKEQLSNLGVKLATEMEKMTSSLQLGFGSFVDKVALPFTDTRPENLRNPCDGCVPPYSFKNHMSLNNDTRSFSNNVKAAKMSANTDTPEGGFDGLMQAMVCSEQINWRKESRRIIVFCTDAHFHIAGDGKLVGVVEPNDGQCHLDRTGEYTHGLIFDYPSISHINAKAKENNMNIIFAVTSKRLTEYTRLKEAIEGASVGVLKEDNDIINLVIDNYNNMSFSITLRDNATESVEIDYLSKCQSNVWEHAAGCSKFKQGDQIEFKANLMVADCSEPEQIIEIKPIGMADSLIVHLEVLCSCECEKETSKTFQLHAKACSNVGNLTCGRCSCPELYEGKKCECNKKDGKRKTGISIEGCTRNNVICSNRGACLCGECVCTKPNNPKFNVTGDYCEYDNFNCPGGSTLCSGHGECVRSECTCFAGWGGPACDCSLEKHTCREPEQPESIECSGRGKCECGRCECETSGKTYVGLYCERCIDCKIECSTEMHLCVDCLVHEMGSYVENCSRCEGFFKNVTKYTDVSEMQNISISSVLCQPLEADLNGCTYRYVPYYSDGELWVLADTFKTCPENNIIAIAAGVVGSTLLAGLVLLVIWKMVTTVHDNREFHKFEKQRKDTKWGRGENPLFRQAMTTHKNPTFIGTEKDE